MRKLFNTLFFLIPLFSFGQNYTPDPGFGNNGVVKKTAAFGSQETYCSGVQTSGKLITGGYAKAQSIDGVVNRYNADGTIDNGFGSAGSFVMNFNTGDEIIYGLAIQADNKIVIGGRSRGGSSAGIDGIIGRLTSDGNPDVSFGNQGFTVFKAIGINSTEVKRVKVGSDGKIYGAGIGFNSLGNERCFVIRLTQTGKIDSTFGVNGIREFGFSTATSRQYLEDIQILTDGKILVAGTQFTTRMQMGIARLTSTGSLDNSFSTDGVHVFSFTTGQNYGIRTTARQDGKYLIFGYANVTGAYQVYGGLFNTDGTQDMTFGTGGAVNFQIFTGGSFIYDLARLSGGDILLSGDSYNGTRYIATAYQVSESGALVTSFGAGGRFSNPNTGVETSAYTIAASNSEIFLGGAQYLSTQNAYQALSAKLLPNGTLNAAFGTGGTQQINMSKPNALSKSLSLLSNGNWMVFGTQENSNNDQSFGQFDPNGTPVSSFGTDGIQRVNLSGRDDFIGRVQLPNGEFVGLANSAYNTINFTSPVVSLTGPTAYTLYRVNSTTGYQASTRVNTSLIANQFTNPIDLQLQANGKVVVLANSSQAVFRTSYLLRHHTNNTLDNSFGNQGRIQVMGSHGNTEGVINFIIDDGNFLVMNAANQGGEFGFRIVKMDSTGTNSPNFGNNIVPGVAQHLLPSGNTFSATRLYKRANGYVISGIRPGSQGAVCLLTPNGLLQGEGYVNLDGFNIVSKVVPLADGGLLIGGNGNNQARITKLLADGTLDNSFGIQGVVTGDYFGQSTSMVDFNLDSENKISILARIWTGSEGNQIGLVKLGLFTSNQPKISMDSEKGVLFPNPSPNGKMNLKTDKPISGIQMVDALGRNWLASFQQSGTYEFEILPQVPLKPGQYQCIIQSLEGEIIRRSIVIQ